MPREATRRGRNIEEILAGLEGGGASLPTEVSRLSSDQAMRLASLARAMDLYEQVMSDPGTAARSGWGGGKGAGLKDPLAQGLVGKERVGPTAGIRDILGGEDKFQALMGDKEMRRLLAGMR